MANAKADESISFHVGGEKEEGDTEHGEHLHYQHPTHSTTQKMGYYNTENWVSTTQKMGYYNTENGVLQHRKWGITTQKMGYSELKNLEGNSLNVFHSTFSILFLFKSDPDALRMCRQIDYKLNLISDLGDLSP